MKNIRVVMMAVVLCFMSSIAGAEVIEGSKIADIVKGADKSTLIVLDLDSTVLEAEQMYGSDAWFYYNVGKRIKAGEPKEKVKSEMYGAWKKIQEVTNVAPVESVTAKTIEEAQEAGMKVMALTARSHDLADLTVKQLKAIGVDLGRRPIYGKDYKWKGDIALYRGGIIFGGRWSEEKYATQDKGVLLSQFLNKIKLSPTKVIFVDDRENNVKAVDKAMAADKIPCECVRYGAADAQYKKYKPEVADLEGHYFGKILSDEAAKAILEFNGRVKQ